MQIEYDVICERYDSRMLDNLVSAMVGVMVEQRGDDRSQQDQNDAH